MDPRLKLNRTNAAVIIQPWGDHPYFCANCAEAEETLNGLIKWYNSAKWLSSLSIVVAHRGQPQARKMTIYHDQAPTFQVVPNEEFR